MTVRGLTEIRLSVLEAGKRLLPLPVAAWHRDVGKRALKGIAKGDDVLGWSATPFESLVAGDPGYSTPQAEFGRPAPRFLQEELEAGARHQAAARADAESRNAARGKDG